MLLVTNAFPNENDMFETRKNVWIMETESDLIRLYKGIKTEQIWKIPKATTVAIAALIEASSSKMMTYRLLKNVIEQASFRSR